MSLVAALAHRLRRLLRPDQHARELREEIEFHLSLDAMQHETASDTSAEYAARRRFGNVTRYQEETREMNGLKAIEMAWQDIRFALRTFRHAPTFTAVAVLTIALGLGATAAIFSVVHAVILEPLPYPQANQIVSVWMDNRRQGTREDWHSYPNLSDLKTQNKVLSHLAPYSESGYNLTGSGEPQRVTAGVMPAEAFAALGVRPLVGSLFTAANEATGSDGVVVLSYGLWQSVFAGDKAVIGRSIELNGRKREIVAVMPDAFGFPSENTQLWVPLVVPDGLRNARSAFAYPAIGKLAAGVSLERARAELSGIATRLEKEYPDFNRALGVYVVPLPEQIVGPTLRTALWIMLGAVAAVLLIACANVANLLLSRAAVREREVTVRLALGASGGRLVRQLLTESLLLSALGGAAGMLLAWLGLRVFRAIVPADLPRINTVSIDGTVLAVTAVVTIATGLLFGLVPAMRSSRAALSDALRDGGRGGTSGRGGQRLRRAIVVGQLATVVVLLTGAGLLIRTFVKLQNVDLGFEAKNVLTMAIQLPGAKYGQAGQAAAFYSALLDRVAAIPGVTAVSSVTTIMLSKTPNSGNITTEGRETRPEDSEVTRDVASANFFRTIGARIVAGREFTAADRDSTPVVAIVNEHMAKFYWGGTKAIGRRFHFGGATTDTTRVPWITVVGIVADMRRTGVDMPVRDEVFLPFTQRPGLGNMLVIKTASDDPLSLTSSVRAAVRGIDPTQPIANVRTMEQQLSRLVAQRRFSMILVGTFAGLAMLLAMIGAYGVTSYLVSQRTREIGVRLALGAEPGAVLRLVVFDGMRLAVTGVAIGVVGAMLTTRLAAGLLYEVSPRDPITIGGVAALLLVVAAAANYLPARRAARVDPLAALRQE